MSKNFQVATVKLLQKKPKNTKQMQSMDFQSKNYFKENTQQIIMKEDI